MKKRFIKTAFKMVTVVIMLAILCSVSVSAAIPYTSYTYDSYGNAVETADLYEPEMVVSGSDISSLRFRQPSDMFVAFNKIYILDSGNSRIVVLNEDFKLDSIIEQVLIEGTPQKLQKSSGIFVDGNKNIYIADNGSNRVLCLDETGNVFKEILKPESEYFSESVEFLPTKLVMDSASNLYVKSTGCYQGLVVFDKEYNFKGFYGADLVQTTAEALTDFFWKQFMTEEQRQQLANYVPPEIQNFDITSKDFIYSVTPAQYFPGSKLKAEMDSIRFLNPRGADRLVNQMSKDAFAQLEYDARSLTFVDVVYDENGFINLLDSQHGKIYQFDKNMNLITAFGTLGDYKGSFKVPTAIEVIGDKILVLDKEKSNLTVFKLTNTGKNVHRALMLYNKGKYKEAMEPWQAVIEENPNFELAYIGIGNALYNEQNYKEAMKYFELGRDSKRYSEAFEGYRSQFLRENMVMIFVVVILTLGLWIVIANRNVLFKRKMRKEGK